MALLTKKKSLKRSLFSLASITVLVFAAFFAVKSFDSFHTKAITGEGDLMTVKYGDDIYYGYSDIHEEGYKTNKFTVTSPDGVSSTGFCANPSKANPDQDQKYQAEDITNTADANTVKLIIYIATAKKDVTEQLMNTYYDPLLAMDSPTNPSSPEDRRYAYAHATIGHIYGDDFGLTEAMVDKIDGVVDDLNRMISNNDDVWLMAKNSKLFQTGIDPVGNEQAVVWIEYNENFSISTVATDAKDGDKFVEASSTASITDTISYCATPNLTYTIQGMLMDKATGKPITVDGSPVQKEITETPTASTGCYTTTMTFNLDTSELYGKDIVVFETLSYEGEPVAEHKDINDASQTVTVISLDTYAFDKNDEDKKLLADKDATITDQIKYCLATGTEYTFVGVLMDKEKGEPLIVNDKIITNSISFKPEKENCGELKMDFKFDATGLAGTEIVVFEAAGVTSSTPLSDSDICLEHDAENPDTCKSYFHTFITHAELDDAAQTIIVADPPKTPETGAVSSEKGSSDGANKMIMTVAIATPVVCVVAYLAHRFMSKKRFLGRR